MRRAAALLAGAAALVSLQGCAPVIAGIAQGGAIIAGIDAGYSFAGRVTTATSGAIGMVCRDWEVHKAAVAQRIADGVVPLDRAKKAGDLAPWLNGTCDPRAPAPKDPLAAAVWVAGLAGRVDALTESTHQAPPAP